jgi:hypothetical protein
LIDLQAIDRLFSLEQAQEMKGAVERADVRGRSNYDDLAIGVCDRANAKSFWSKLL